MVSALLFVILEKFGKDKLADLYLIFGGYIICDFFLSLFLSLCLQTYYLQLKEQKISSSVCICVCMCVPVLTCTQQVIGQYLNYVKTFSEALDLTQLTEWRKKKMVETCLEIINSTLTQNSIICLVYHLEPERSWENRKIYFPDVTLLLLDQPDITLIRLLLCKRQPFPPPIAWTCVDHRQ